MSVGGVPTRGTREAFRSPDAWHAPATYWFWHHLPDDAQIRTQVGEMHAAGFRSFQIQARLSFPQGEYLDEAYLRACAVAVAEAERLGMIVGIYDDYNWQTGHAGGLAVAGHDALRERQLFWTRVPLVGGRGTGEITGIRSATENLGPAAMAWHYEGGEVRWADWRIEHVIVGTRDDVSSAEWDADAASCRIRVATGSDATSALVLVSARADTSRLVNPLDPAAVERFVEAGYEPFRRAVGEHFGDAVRYVFFDQPHAIFYDWAERAGDPRSALPFHEAFAARMRERWGEQVPEVWLAVIDEATDAGALALRAQFWELFAGYAIDTFLGTLSRWSSAHGLLQTGHEVLGHVGSWTPGASFGNWDLRANFGLDHFGVDRFRDLTAVDAQDAIAQLSPRLGDAVARASGRHGTMVEQYFMTPPEGGTPWSGHWGLTLDELRTVAIRHHFAGMRQMVFHGFYQTHGHGDDHESLRNPRFDFPPGVNFEPWFTGHHAAYAAEAARLSEFLDGWTDAPEVALLWPLRTFWTHGQDGAHADHLGEWARALAEAGVPFRLVDERQLATLAQELPTVRALVLPAVRTLAAARSVDAIRDLVAWNVAVHTSGAAPEVLQEDAASAVEMWRTVGAIAREHVPAAADVRAALRLPADPLAPALAAGLLVRTGIAPDGSTRAAVFHGGTHPLTVAVPIATAEWDPADGVHRPTARTHRLEPGELRLFVLPADTAVAVVDRAVPETPRRTLAGAWTLALPDGTETEVDVAAGWQVQHPEFSGVATYRTSFVDDAASDLVLRLPRVAGAATVALNGEELGARGWRPYRFTLPQRSLIAGENTLEITVAGSAANAFYAGTGLRPAPEPDGLLAVPTLERIPSC